MFIPTRSPSDPKMGGYELMVAADIFRGRYRESFSESESNRAGQAVALPICAAHGRPRLSAGTQDHGADSVELVPALRSQSADLRAEHLLGEAADYKKAVQRIYVAPGEESFIELPVVH